MKQGEDQPLRGDFLQQLLHVGRNAHRLIVMQDRDTCSPSFGCFHYPYWRDKTSDFPDARYQEAGATLGLLSLPIFDELRNAEGWPSRDDLMACFSAGLRNLARQQYPEGCYDEWYKGERGFAATAFTTVAFGISGVLLGDRLSVEDSDLLTRTLDRAAHWLSKREDLVKTNHEVVAATALAAVWKLTGEARWRQAAAHKLHESFANRTDEGWFLELGGADLGYGHLILDHLMLYEWIIEDGEARQAASRLLAFLLPHLHPDMTTSAEGGTCRNPYVGQIGFLLLRGDHTAEGAVALLSAMHDSATRIYCYLGDDLRLARWSFYPVLAGYFSLCATSPPACGAFEFYPRGWTVHPRSGLAAYHCGELHVYVPAAGGAVTRVFRADRLILEDLGIDIREADLAFSARSHRSGRTIVRIDKGVSVSVTFGRTRYIFPNFLQRLVLRLGSVTPWSSRILRAAIDRYRVKHGTSGNQTAASVQSGTRRFHLQRAVEIDGDTVCITDVVRDAKSAMSVDTLFNELGPAGVGKRLPAVAAGSFRGITIVKSISTNVAQPELRFDVSYD